MMGGAFSAFVTLLDRLVNFFIPEKIAAKREISQRAHVFLVSHILGPFIGNVVPIAIYMIDPAPGYDVAVLAISITSFWVFPFLLKAGVPYYMLALASIENLIFCIFWSCYFYGGLTSPTLPWVLTIPLLAFFYLGSAPQLRFGVMTMFAANVGIFVWFYVTSDSERARLPVDAMQALGLVSTTAAALYVTMMALYYAKILASQSELEAEMKQHLVTAAALRAATREAEQAGAAKSEFLAKMSHELRTPLNAVIGYSQILIEDAEDEGDTSNVGDLKKIHEAGEHLLELINRILDLSKIEAGKMTITTHAFALIELLQEAVGLMSAQASEKGIVIALDLDPNLPHEVVGDATRINQILGNLLSNAIKFTERGRVALNATVIDSGDGNTIVEFAVSDTGIGIDGKDIKRLFTPFTQVDDSATRRFGGTGLGLAIVKRLVDAMGGELGVSSEPGRGSRFWCRLMLNRVDGDTTAHAHRSADDELPAVEDAVPPQLPGIRVLVVDDSEINRDVAHQVLQLEGASVWMAANSDEALAILQSRAQQIDVVLMDLQMPGLDGLETTRRIRRDLGLHELPIIALTAAALPIERQRATAAGMQGFLTKPIDPQSMIDQIDRVTGNAGALTPVPAREVMATSNRNWPAIEGIDIDGARARLGGDGELLRSLLSRLFEEYRDLWERDPAPDMIAQPQPLAARMHKLKGAAANLGASRVCEGAAALERALCDGRLDEVERLADTLRTALTGLHEAFAGIRQAGSEPLCGGTTLDSGLLEELVGLLHRHDLAAGNAFQALSKALAGVLDADHFERLRRHLDALEYDAAAAILEALPADGAAATIG